MLASNRLKFRHVPHDGEQPVRMRPSALDRWIFAFCSMWFIGGLFLDGWAHIHVPELETFFTPWHGVFYSGYAVSLLALVVMTLRNKRIGLSLRDSIPVGYDYAFIGAAIFFVGGIGDFAWHEVFGIEADIEALLSPTHLILATGMSLMLSANLREWWTRTDSTHDESFPEQLPMVLSLTFVLSLLTFMTQFANTIVVRSGGVPPDSGRIMDLSQEMGVASTFWQTVLCMGCVFILLKRRQPAFGAFTLMFGLNMLGLALMRDGGAYVPSAILAGLSADILVERLFPLDQHLKKLRMFSFAIPAILFAGYFFTVAVTQGIWWSVHMWTGTIVIAGFVGLLLSLVAFPMRTTSQISS